MRARFKIEKPEEAEATMTITMPLKDWESLRDELNGKWPASELCSKINDLLSQARKIFWTTED